VVSRGALKKIWYVTYYHSETFWWRDTRVFGDGKTQNIFGGINQQIEDKTKARNFLIFVATFMYKSLGTLAFLRLFPSNTHRSNPSPHPSDWRVQSDFSEINLCQGWGRRGDDWEKGRTFLWGNAERTDKYEYFVTVPRIIVHNCRIWFLLKPK